MTKNDQNRLSKKPPSPNQPCIFPFTWMGKQYNKCTKDDHDQFWCGTQSNVTKDEISFLDNGVTQGWGNCIDLSLCPKEGGKKIYSLNQYSIESYFIDAKLSLLLLFGIFIISTMPGQNYSERYFLDRLDAIYM